MLPLLVVLILLVIYSFLFIIVIIIAFFGIPRARAVTECPLHLSVSLSSHLADSCSYLKMKLYIFSDYVTLSV